MILDGTSAAAVARAAQTLAAGELLGLPTETVYGLAADADNPSAVAKIFAAKGRPSDHPLIVHVAEIADTVHYAPHLPAFAQQLMRAFWPGPLTVIVPCAPGVARAATGGQDSVGLRCPSHPVAQAVLRAARAVGVKGVAAPSANAFGRVSPTTAAHVEAEFATLAAPGSTDTAGTTPGTKPGTTHSADTAGACGASSGLLTLDGGACEVGIESTIIDCTRGVPVLLRPGVLSRAHIESVCGWKLALPQDTRSASQKSAPLGPAPKASGTLEAHYAPRAPVRLMDGATLQTALDLLGPKASGIAVWARANLKIRASALHSRRMPDDAGVVAHQLFAVLRQFDDLGVRLIWIETLPPSEDWDGVRDRLQRASAAA
jgi:L-threonylcarbamoyladenylate synthase